MAVISQTEVEKLRNKLTVWSANVMEMYHLLTKHGHFEIIGEVFETIS